MRIKVEKRMEESAGRRVGKREVRIDRAVEVVKQASIILKVVSITSKLIDLSSGNKFCKRLIRLGHSEAEITHKSIFEFLQSRF